jgi:predicted nucleotidyltransferase
MPNKLDLPERHLQTLRQLLAIHVPSIEVWAYGSRVTGGGHETSDLDIVLRNPQAPKQSTKHYPELKEALQQSTIPIFIDVHDWAHLPESFHREIERCHVVIQEGECT